MKLNLHPITFVHRAIAWPFVASLWIAVLMSDYGARSGWCPLGIDPTKCVDGIS